VVKQDLPALKSSDVIKALEKAGFQIKRQTGSHIIYISPNLKDL